MKKSYGQKRFKKKWSRYMYVCKNMVDWWWMFNCDMRSFFILWLILFYFSLNLNSNRMQCLKICHAFVSFMIELNCILIGLKIKMFIFRMIYNRPLIQHKLQTITTEYLRALSWNYVSYRIFSSLCYVEMTYLKIKRNKYISLNEWKLRKYILKIQSLN